MFLLRAVSSWCCSQTEETGVPLRTSRVAETSVTLRPATPKERDAHLKENSWSATWLARNCWSRMVGAVNFIALVWNRDMSGVLSAALGKDPYVTESALYYIRKNPNGWAPLRLVYMPLYVTDHPKVISTALVAPRHSDKPEHPFFMDRNALSIGAVVNDIFRKHGADFENFILTANADNNERLRNLLHRYLKPAVLQKRRSEIEALAEATAKEWAANLGQTLDVRPLAKLYTNRVLSTLFLNRTGDPTQLQWAVDIFSEHLKGQVMGKGPSQDKLDRARQIFATAIEEAIQAGGEHNIAADMKKADDKFSEQDIALMSWTLFLGAIDNSSESLTWTLLMLAQNPDVQEELRNDFDQMIGPVLAESLRTFPPVDVGRMINVERDAILEVAREDGSAREIYLEGGKVLFMRVTDAAKRAEIYGKETDGADIQDISSFNPRRFAKGFKAHMGLAFHPFGGGANSCPGWKLAVDEMTELLRVLMRDYRLTTTQSGRPQTKGTGLNKIEGDVFIQLEPRNV